MPVSALIITLSDDREQADASLLALEADPHFELGARDARRVAAALDTPNEEANKRCWRWLNRLPGVSFVDLLFVHLDPLGATPDRSGSK